MVIYSGFSTRRQQQKYNQLIKELLNMLSQMIITYIESAKIIAFRQSFEKIQFQLSKMDQYKYSDIKVSQQIEPLTQHIINGDLASEVFTQPLKRKTDHRTLFRTKRNVQEGNKSLQEGTTRSIESAKGRPKDDKRRSLSMTSEKHMGRILVEGEAAEPTMEELMRMHPLIERKMGNIRKKRYFKERNNNNFALIQEEEDEGEEKQ